MRCRGNVDVEEKKLLKFLLKEIHLLQLLTNKHRVMAEPCWINASNKTDLPRKSGIYWFCYCVINIKIEPGCSRIILEIPLYWSPDEPPSWATMTKKTASVPVWCLNVYEQGWESSGKCDGDLSVRLRLLLWDSGQRARSQHGYIAPVTQESSGSWTCRGAGMWELA